MTFSRVKEFGYNTGDVIPADELNQLDIDHSLAIDGSGGGTYDNDPITLEGDLTIEGTFIAPGVVALDGITNLTGAAINIGPLGTSAVTIGSPLVVNADATLGASSGDTLEIKATSTVSSSITLNGGVALGNILIGTGIGRIRPRVTIGADANASYGPATTDIVYVTTGVLSANRQYTIDDTGAGNGDTITFATEDSAFSIEILNPSSSTIGLIQRVNGSNTAYTFIRVDGLWRVLDRSYYDDSSP